MNPIANPSFTRHCLRSPPSAECHEILAQLAVSKVICDSLNAYAIANAPINKQKHKCFPWVLERDRLLISYIGLLRQLRETVQATKRDPEPSLDDLLNEAE